MALKQGLSEEEKLSLPTPPWIELPSDITRNILHRLGAVEILETAQKVCTTWSRYLLEMCCDAVDRSQGQLVDLNLERVVSEELLDYIATRSEGLRRLRLYRCYDLSDAALIEALKRFPNLESLNVTHGTSLSTETVEMIGRSCPLLTSFAFNQRVRDKKAFAIARSMPELRCLQMMDNRLTNKALEAILDGCPRLESLDLDLRNSLKLEGSALEKRLSSQIKCLTYSECSDTEFDASDWEKIPTSLFVACGFRYFIDDDSD